VKCNSGGSGLSVRSVFEKVPAHKPLCGPAERFLHSREPFVHSTEWIFRSAERFLHSRERSVHSVERFIHPREWLVHSRNPPTGSDQPDCA
jgi:hypothetical protein